jgi:hypothetical protein
MLNEGVYSLYKKVPSQKRHVLMPQFRCVCRQSKVIALLVELMRRTRTSTFLSPPLLDALLVFVLVLISHQGRDVRAHTS